MVNVEALLAAAKSAVEGDSPSPAVLREYRFLAVSSSYLLYRPDWLIQKIVKQSMVTNHGLA
jgi:hypothetical protein